jgi:hypothetical protein
MSSSWSEPLGAGMTAEESYEQSIAHAEVLWSGARRVAAQGDAVSALALAWGSDVHVVKALLWQHILGASAATRRHLYRAALALVLPQHPSVLDPGDARTCGEALEQARTRMLSECDQGLADAIRSAWRPVADLGSITAPGMVDVQRSVQERLEGRSSQAFIAARREAARSAMVRARDMRVRGQGEAAIDEIGRCGRGQCTVHGDHPLGACDDRARKDGRPPRGVRRRRRTHPACDLLCSARGRRRAPPARPDPDRLTRHGVLRWVFSRRSRRASSSRSCTSCTRSGSSD